MPDKATTFPLNDNENAQFDIENSSKPLCKPLNKGLENDTENTGLSIKDNIKIVVGIDFGTTHSGFAYCYISDSRNLIVNTRWPGEFAVFKTNTALQYDSDYTKVEQWGYPTLSKRPKRRRNKMTKQPVELFKLHLGNLRENLRPKLPAVDYKKVITDYLREFGKLIRETIESHWSKINFFENVLLVLPVPAEYSGRDIAIIRECVFSAGLLEEKSSTKLQFTTKPEAAAIYCMENELQRYDLLSEGTTFMIVDCGGGTVDLTIYELIENNQLSEITERVGDFCGSTFIDKEFIKFLCARLGTNAIVMLMKDHYEQLQFMVQEFCKEVKLPFTGENIGFCYDLDIETVAPILLQYVSGEFREILEDEECIIKIRYDDIKAMFDPIIDKILRLILAQLSNYQEPCSAIFLVGGFSENIYLQKRIKEEFRHMVNIISVLINPVAATACGAAIYGLSLKNSSNWNKMNNQKFMISTRTLKFTYGIRMLKDWTVGDPIDREVYDGRIYKFDCLAKRGTLMNIDQEITRSFKPYYPTQTIAAFSIFYTNEYDAKYCDEPGMNLLGSLKIILSSSGRDGILFGLNFGQMEITATAKNETNGQIFETKFVIDTDELAF